MDFNKVFLIGNMTADPDIQTFQNGGQIARFTIAVNRSYTDKYGEVHDSTQFLPVVAKWAGTIDIIKKLGAKGKRVHIEGSIETREYEKDGDKRRITEIILQSFILLSPKSSTPGPGQPTSDYVESIDDIPF